MTDVNQGNPSILPPMREIAEDLRDGEELSVLAAGLPLEPVSHERRPRRRFLGLDWTTSPASGPRWEWK